MISFYPEPKGYDCISSTWIFKEKMNLEGKKKFCQWVLEFEQRSKLSIGTEWKASGPFHKSKREFFVWFERRSKAKKSKEIPLWKGKETSVASYYLARITSAITSVFRSPFVFEPGVHVEPFQYVRVCKPTSLFLCSYLQKKWDSFHYFPGPQRPGLRSCRILFSEFGTFSLSPESCRCWSEIADYHHIVPILYTNLMDQELRRNKDRSMIFYLERNVLVIVQFMHSRKLD